MEVWRAVAGNWSDLCVSMGCMRTQMPHAVAHTYPINRSGPFYNLTLVNDPQSSIDDVEKIYEKNGLPFAIVTPRLESYAKLQRSLADRGYALPPPWGLMILDRLTGEVNTLVKVNSIDRSVLNEWFALQDAFPQVPSSKVARQRMIELILEDEAAQFLLATIEGKPVGAGLLYIRGQVASIHMIATHPAFRRRHVATTVTLEASRRAIRDKAELIWLRTRRGGTGEKVYTKMGFKLFTDLLSYTRTLECEDSNIPPIG